MENNSNTEKLQICRTCMKELENKCLFFSVDFIDANTKTELTIKQKLYDCIPELDLGITPNAVICYECADIVTSIYKFKNECLRVEMKIRKYMQQMQQTDNVDLVEVVQFHHDPYGNPRTELKTEAFEIIENFKADESTLCYSNNCNEAERTAECTEREYLLSMQKMDLENVPFNTDDNFNYSTLESKEILDIHDSSVVPNNISQIVDKQDGYIHGYSTEDNQAECGNYSYSKYNSKNHSKLIYQESNTTNDFGRDTGTTPKAGSQMLKKLFKCSVCKYECCRNSTLKVHMRIHTSKNHFKCSVCEYQCTAKSSLKMHMRIHTGEKPFKCSMCKYQCTQKNNLQGHLRIHTGEKPFKCSICEYQCAQKNHVKEHMRIHTGEKPFKCLLCVYQSTTKSNLKVHMRIHTGEKPFKCSVCEYQCTVKNNLKAHIMRNHTGEKPFKCSVCEYQCTMKRTLEMHMRIHTGEEPYKCSVCAYQCTTKRNLKVHMRIHTNENPLIFSL